MKRPRRSRFSASPEGRFRIHDSGAGQSVVDPAAFTEEEIDAPAEEDGARESADSAAPFRPLGSSRPAGRRPFRKRRFTLRLTLLVSVVSLLVGGLAGYGLARSARGGAGSGGHRGNREKVELLTAADQDALDAAYAARHAHQFTQAEQLFTALGHKHPHWDTMDIEVGRTLLHQRNYLGARAALNAVADNGPATAEASLYIGVAFNAEKSYPEAEASFARAAALDPSQPDGYFLWGECLRAQGKLMDAMSKFRSALLRNEDETGAGLYRVKLWLCAIEANQEKTDGTSAEIDAALAQPLPPMEALFAAAARDLKNGDVKAAAARLRNARERADSTVFLLIMSDPLFADARLKPEMAELFGKVSPPASR